MKSPESTAGIQSIAAALTILDGDMPQYIHDNTDDEISHAAFLKAYLESKGAEPLTSARLRLCPAVKRPEPGKSDGSQTSPNSR